MTGLMTVLLLSIAALTVDIGRAYVEKRDVQKVVDFAALAGAAGTNLPGTIAGACAGGYTGNRPAATDQAVRDVATHLATATWTGSPTAADLVDCVLSNGEVVYGTLTFPSAGTPSLSYDKTQLTVVSPSRQVDFGFARVMGFNDASVQGRATAAVGTPGAEKVFPAFATDGCDWGQRTVFAPASSSTGPTFTPSLAFPNDRNVTTFDLSIENPSPDSVPVNPAATTVTITGTDLDLVTKIGFFQEDTGVYQTSPKSAFDEQTVTGIRITLPEDLPTLTTAAGLWWVRVLAPKQNASDTTFEWSQIKSGTTLMTIPFEVGESFLRCAGVAAGSFGDVLLPRTDVTSANWTAMNIAKNLQIGPPRLSLNTYPGSPTTVFGASSAPNVCVTSDTRTIYSTTTGTPDLKVNTNCVDNGTGLTANDATAGLIAGVLTQRGRLVQDVDSSCAPRKSVTVSGPSGTKLINNDVLTCFMNAGVPISEIARKGYLGGTVLSCDVFDSPRFLYQPVLQVRPSNGGSTHYSIVDFRPAFISEQLPTAMKGAGAINNNGVTITGGKVTQLDVVFFHPNALPTDCTNGFGPLLGGTTKRTIRLID